MLKYILAWFPMLIIAIANGALREMLFKKYLNDLRAHQLSTVTLILFFAGYIWYIIRKWPPDSQKQSILIGVLWLLLTLCFEFGFGYYRGNTWNKMLAEYNLFEGRLWIFIPLWVLLAPYIFYKLK